ncbi:MAG: UPF0182 family protein, partial [Deltaproteobacteria bacterium]|nr:UPF0182 family protein [Deltaproteobacteria bacterium]
MKKKLIIAAVALAIISGIIGSLAVFWTEYEWFRHLGFSEVYLTQLFAQLGTAFAFGLVALFVFALHVRTIKRNSKPRKDWTIPTPEGDLDIKEIVSKVGTPVIITAALAVAVLMGFIASRHWEDVLKFFNQTPFGQKDPVLGRDIGFYLFTLPTMQFTQEWLVYLSGGAAFFSAAIYFLRGEIVVKERWPIMSDGVRGHLLFSLACVVAVIGWGYRIEMFEALFSKRGVAYGATYTDVYASLVAFRIMIGACAVLAVFLLYAMRSPWRGKDREIKYPAYGLAAMFGLYLVGTFVWPTVVQKFVVTPNELQKELPYLKHAIANTREAYDLEKIQVKEFAADDKLTFAGLDQNKTTIENIKIWDHRPLRATYQQLQVIRLYYDFPNISVDRYRIGDNYWQVMLSARELVHDQLPAQSKTWLNQRLTYTHGYGACLSPVNRVSEEGLPDLWVKDLPPNARHPDLKITQPEIYYGMQTNDYVLVKTEEQEFDFPEGSENRYTTYAGKGGVAIGGFIRRLLFSLRFGDYNLFFTPTLKEESRVLFNRSVQERVRTVAPFLMLDQEPYITVVNGRMLWVQDAYTISYRYPYSQPTSLGRRQRINYIRNSVKAVVDAYNGSVTLYIWDDSDPMIRTYAKIFPSLFKKKSEIPAKLRDHMRYPKDLFTIQAVMYESFHMTNPRVWYNQEDKWSIAGELAEKTVRRVHNTTRTKGRRASQPRSGAVSANTVTQQSRMSPYYMIMKLPEEKQEEFLLMVPYTPSNKDNMVAWMTARCDGDNYGKLLVYTFPKQKLIFGPMQIEARIDQDDYISQWITLRNQQGSTVIRGDLLVIPIESSLLYVEPIYLQATQTQLPELKQVIVAFDQKVVMKPTLKGALAAVFGLAKRPSTKPMVRTPSPVAGTTSPVQLGGDTAQLVGQALKLYQEGQAGIKAGDWAAYGKSQDDLRQTLESLSKSLEGKLPPPKLDLVVPASNPAVEKPATVKPATVKPAAVKPAAVKPAAVKPAAVKPAAVKPAAVKPAAVK